MIHKRNRVLLRVGLALTLIQAWHSANAVSVTGDVTTESGFVQMAQAITVVRWNWLEMPTYEEVFAFARINIGNTVATDSTHCDNFAFPTQQQTCTALAVLNQCTEGCPYTGRGHGDKIDIVLGNVTNVRLGNWGPKTVICDDSGLL